MKTLIIAAFLSVATTGAFAEGSTIELPQTMKAAILQLVPDADLSNVSRHQYARLHSLFVSSANLRTSENPADRIKIILASEE